MRLPQALPYPGRIRVQWKIMLPFVVLTALFAVFATRNVTQLVSESLEERVDGQLVSATRYANDAVAKRERDHVEIIRTVSNTEGVAEAVERGSAAGLGDAVLPIAANSGAHRIEVFGQSGARLYGVLDAQNPATRTVLSSGAPGMESPALTAALAGRQDARGDKWAEIAAGPDGAFLVTAGPLKNADGKVVGAIAVSTPLGALAIDIKANSFAEITVTDLQGSIAASTFDPADADEENGFLRGSGRPEAGVSSAGLVLGRPFRFLNSELVVRGEVVGQLSVAASVDTVRSTSNETRMRMSLIFGVITLAVAAIGWGVARHLTAPLSRLLAAATAVAKGDFSARSNVRTQDEIGLLGLRFDSMAEQLEQQHIATIGALASAIDARDPYTAGHSLRVGDLSAELGIGIGMAKPAVQHLRVGGLLHDIGKIGIRDTILLKPGSLTPEERRVIQQHPSIGLRILEGARLPSEVLEIVGGHHERLNGSGYPLGLSEEELSMFPRIAAVADVYDALTTDRPYRKSLSAREALDTLEREVEGGLLDAEVVATMRRIAKVWEERRQGMSIQTGDWLASLQAARLRAA